MLELGCGLLPTFAGIPVPDTEAEVAERLVVGADETSGVGAAGVVRTKEDTGNEDGIATLDEESVSIKDGTTWVAEITGGLVVVVNIMTEIVGVGVTTFEVGATTVWVTVTIGVVSVITGIVATVGTVGCTRVEVGATTTGVVPKRAVDAVDTLDWSASERTEEEKSSYCSTLTRKDNLLTGLKTELAAEDRHVGEEGVKEWLLGQLDSRVHERTSSSL